MDDFFYREPVAINEIVTDKPITGFVVQSERSGITVFIFTDQPEPLRYFHASDATVKNAVVRLDHENPCHATIQNY